MKGARKAGRKVQSVERAVMILELLASEQEGLSLSRIAERLDLRPQTAQGLLRTLEAHEMVVQGGRGAPYVLGPGVHRLSRKWMGGRDGAMLARKTVQDLARSVGEYVLLAELRGGTLMPLVEANPEQPLMVTSEGAFSGHLHSMATGKLLMAYLDKEQREEIVASLDLEKAGPRSVTDPAELRRQLERIRRQGYAVCIEENTASIAAVAVPVRGAARRVVAALGVALPRIRFPVARRRELRERLQAAAAEIERLWGAGA